jgi:hypothetical protein
MNKQPKAILAQQMINKALRLLLRMLFRRLRGNGGDLLGRKERRQKHVQHDDP